jgi:DNA polymerase I
MSEGDNRSLSDFATEKDGDTTKVAEAAAVADGEGHIAGVVDPEAAKFPAADDYLEIAVTQVDYTIEGTGTEEYPVVHVFGRTESGGAEHVRVLGVEPYFYVPVVDLEDRSPNEEFDAVVDVRYSDADGNNFESIRGEELAKIVARTPRDVGAIREEYDRTFEADVLFPNRFLVDRGIWSGMRVPARRLEDGTVQVPVQETEGAEVSGDLRVNTFDIEVDDRQGFPEDGEEPIVCLTSHDSRRDEYVAWHYQAPDGDAGSPASLPHEDRLDTEASVEIRAFDEEAEMLDDFLSYITETDPDVLTGWNFEDFDAPYLLDRLEVIGLDPERLSRVNEVWRSGWGGPDVKGRVVFDLLYAYQRTKRSELDSYRLDDVGAEELGVGKERYEGDLGDLWERDPEQLLAYNVRDVEICVELDRQQGIIAFWNEARRIVGCMLEDATTPGDAVDMYVLHKAAGKFALPSKGQQDAEDFEGGAVFDPITGVRENVSVLDLRSLYPMSMVTINASPETKVDADTYDGATYRTPSGVHFRKSPDGIIREMVDELLAEREEKKAARDEHDPKEDAYDRYDRQQAAVKVIMNSLYGVFGWDRFRLYDREMSAGVTSTNREVISFTEDAAGELGYDVVYGDTDSVMLEIGYDASVDEAIETSFEIEDYINDRYDEFALEELGAEEHRFEIEFEKLYRRFFQAGKKKRYAGHIVWKEGVEVDDVDITGFEYKRSDIAPITKEVQSEVIERIVHGEDIDKVEAYVHDVIEDFRSGNVDVEAVGIPGGIGKRLDNYDTDTAHVRGAKYANLVLGTNFQRGSKPKRLYLKKVHPEFFERFEEENPEAAQDPLYTEFRRDPDVICIEYADQLPEAFEVDWEKMLNKTLKGPIERVLEALEVSWEEVKAGQTQTGLSNFM